MAKGKKTGGRRPGSKNRVPPAIREIALAMVPDANKTLSGLLKGASDQVKIRAIEIVYERAFGRPKQSLEIGNTTNPETGQEDVFTIEFVNNGKLPTP